MIKSFCLDVFHKGMWVAINPTYEEVTENVGIHVKDSFYDEFSISDYNDMKEELKGSTTRVCDKKEPHVKGYLVNIPVLFDKDLDIPDLVNTITHEAVHVCDLMKQDTGMSDADTETNAYISGFCSECITKTILEYKNESQSTSE